MKRSNPPSKAQNSSTAPPPHLNVIDIRSLTDAVTENYANFALTANNDHVIRASVIDRDFHWHFHRTSDETFLVLEGELIIDVEGQSLSVKPGQIVTVPRNVLHRTRPIGRTVNLTFEHRDTQPAGDDRSEDEDDARS